MFFKRKKKGGGEGEGPEGGGATPTPRKHYRRTPSRKQALGVQIDRQGKTLGSAEVGDVSIGGVRLIFPKHSQPPDLRAGDVVDLSFFSIVHGGKVQAQARFVRPLMQPDGSTQHSLAFTDLDALYPQLDAFFWNFFNRRSVVRVRPALDRRLPLALRAGTVSTEVGINDLSPRGLGFLLEAARAEPLLAASSYELSFPIPGSEERFACRSERRHATTRGRNVLFGLEFVEIEATPSPALARYLSEREAEMARWE